MSGGKTWKIAMSIVTLVVCLAYSVASAFSTKCLSDGKPCMSTWAVTGCCGLMGAASLGLAAYYWSRGGGGL